ARILSYCMKVKIVPLEVQGLFGVVEPSWGRIGRAECHTPVRRIQEIGGTIHRVFVAKGATKVTKNGEKILRDSTDNVTLLGGATLPTEVKEVLQKGPKFSFEPSTTRPELLAMVRRVADRAGEKHKERAIGDGVDFLKDT
ncbi:hypothetical protein HPB47_015290, partial [Ixodes persulcatus]